MKDLLQQVDKLIKRLVADNLPMYAVWLQNVIATQAGQPVNIPEVNGVIGIGSMNWDTGDLSRSVTEFNPILNKERLSIIIGSDLEYARFIENGVPPYSYTNERGNVVNHPGIRAYQPFHKGMMLASDEVIIPHLDRAIEEVLGKELDKIFESMFD